MPKGALFALALLAGAELVARGLLAKGDLKPDPSLRTTLKTRLDEIRKEHPPIWFVGNSTLDWGVDAPLFEQLLHTKIIKLSHGSATLNASAAMLQFDIDNAGEKPRQVIVTLTKDDLNTNGYRADFSRSYLDMAKTETLPSGDWLALREARGNIRDAAESLVERPSKKSPSTKPAYDVYDGQPMSPQNKFEVNLLKNYQLGVDWFAQLKAVCDRNQLPPPILVLMPPTDQYIAFHDRMIASPKFAEVHQQVLDAIHENGMKVLDYWTQPRTDYAHFRDPYHLNPIGEDLFTRQLAEDLQPLLPPGVMQSR